MKPEWLVVTAEELTFELDQLEEEGKRVGELESEFETIISKFREDEPKPENIQDRVDVVDSAVASDRSVELQDEANDLLDRARKLPNRTGYPYDEPNSLEAIREARPNGPRTLSLGGVDEDGLYDRVYGAWLGRCAGCLLGKPVEGWTRETMRAFLSDLDRYPLESYFRSDVPEAVLERYDIDPEGIFSSCIDRVDHMIEDDDTNYTVAGLSLLSATGLEFDSEDVARYWMRNVPILRTMTAERIAYRNFVNLISPPESALHRNPCREWIGAQIRADPFGYVCLGDPERAAELAWRDARVSHVKNGIYGSMWTAAMTAVAPCMSGMRDVVEVGLSEIPAESRLSEAIEEVLTWDEDGIQYEAAIDRIHERWDETYYHHWCHTIGNAQIVAVSLLWNDGSVGSAISRAVEAGFDTDSNGATVGSIIGMHTGASQIDAQWTDPLNDTIETGIDGYERTTISTLAEETIELGRR